MSKRFIVFPGEVESTYDRQVHYIGGNQLIDLYGVPPEDCVIYTSFMGDKYDKELLPLHPRRDGKYKESLLQWKLGDFATYQRACALYEHNSTGRNRHPAAPEFAKRNKKSMEWHEKTWPDFPEALARLKK